MIRCWMTVLAMAVLTAKHVPSWVLGEVRATSEADEAPAHAGHAVLQFTSLDADDAARIDRHVLSLVTA